MKVCDICQKGYIKGNSVPRGIGHRVTKRNKRRQMPNLRNKTLVIDGVKVRTTICTSCLKRLKKEGIIPTYQA